MLHGELIFLTQRHVIDRPTKITLKIKDSDQMCPHLCDLYIQLGNITRQNSI